MNRILKISIIFFCLIVLCTSFAFATTPLLNTSLDEVVDTSLNNVITNIDSQIENKDDIITFSNYEDILKDDITNTLNSTNNEEEYKVEENVIIEDVVNEDLHLVGTNINISSPEVNISYQVSPACCLPTYIVLLPPGPSVIIDARPEFA